jgi:hypothetical protein
VHRRLARSAIFTYPLPMDRSSWHEEVAQLLEECAASLRARSDRRAVVAFGTAVAYLHKAKGEGERLAGELMAQLTEVAGDGSTQRFTFAPGELEEIENKAREK